MSITVFQIFPLNSKRSILTFLYGCWNRSFYQLCAIVLHLSCNQVSHSPKNKPLAVNIIWDIIWEISPAVFRFWTVHDYCQQTHQVQPSLKNGTNHYWCIKIKTIQKSSTFKSNVWCTKLRSIFNKQQTIIHLSIHFPIDHPLQFVHTAQGFKKIKEAPITRLWKTNKNLESRIYYLLLIQVLNMHLVPFGISIMKI